LKFPQMAKFETIYGIHAVKHTLEQSPENILEIWIQDNKRTAATLEQITQLSSGLSLPIQYVSKQAIDNLSRKKNHQGVLIKYKQASSANISLNSLLENIKDMPLFLVLDGVQDPQNLGACLRTANAAGVTAVIIPKDRAAKVNATVRKVASGAAEKTPVITVTNIARTLKDMKDAGIWIIGTAENATTTIFDEDFNKSLAIVMGGEGKGLRQNTRKKCDAIVNIPMLGNIESLNISVATGVCLFEVVRQRQN